MLVIEDEDALRLALVDALQAAGCQVTEAADGDAGLALALASAPELILLDLMLPRRDGFSVLKALREDRLASAVIILSARGEEWDRLQGFEYGADDYLVKPFSVQELLLRMRALMERVAGSVPGLEAAEAWVFGDRRVDLKSYSLTRGKTRIGLSRREMELLRFFLQNQDRALSRDEVLRAVWGDDEYPSNRTIDTHVLKLRKKIEDNPEQPRFLRTVHGVGYQFVSRPE